MRITYFGNHRRLALVAALGIIICVALALPARAGMADAVKAQTLANGLRVLVLEITRRRWRPSTFSTASDRATNNSARPACRICASI